jgi:hypothetical protein
VDFDFLGGDQPGGLFCKLHSHFVAVREYRGVLDIGLERRDNLRHIAGRACRPNAQAGFSKTLRPSSISSVIASPRPSLTGASTIGKPDIGPSMILAESIGALPPSGVSLVMCTPATVAARYPGAP